MMRNIQKWRHASKSPRFSVGGATASQIPRIPKLIVATGFSVMQMQPFSVLCGYVIAYGLVTSLACAADDSEAFRNELVSLGFKSLLSEDCLEGWQAEIGTPPDVSQLARAERDQIQIEADKEIARHWRCEDGILVSDGKGRNLRTVDEFENFEFYVDWRISPDSDSGVYLRGFPQVQIWDPANEKDWQHGSDKGSGALWNNKDNPRFPLIKADRPAGEWNRFYVRIIGDRVTVTLNGMLTVDDVRLENAWVPDEPIASTGAVVLQSHGAQVDFRNIFIREIIQRSRLCGAHAHNDYQHARPLFDALSQGFSSVEADVILLGNELLVAHAPYEIRSDRTLDRLYLKPLSRLYGSDGDSITSQQDPLLLLVDFKTAGPATYAVLREQLKPYRSILTRWSEGDVTPGKITILLSGNVPTNEVAAEEEALCGIDGRLSDLDDPESALQKPLISASWQDEFQWRGSGEMPVDEKQKLLQIVESAHRQGRRVRFWATPENEKCWEVLRECGVDYIGTDDLNRLKKFLGPHAGAGKSCEAQWPSRSPD